MSYISPWLSWPPPYSARVLKCKARDLALWTFLPLQVKVDEWSSFVRQASYPAAGIKFKMNSSSWPLPLPLPVSMSVLSHSTMLLRFALDQLSRLVRHLLGYFPFQRAPPIEVLYRSEHFLVVNKPHDLVLNSDDPSRDSLHSRMAMQMPQLADFHKYQVQCSLLAVHLICWRIWPPKFPVPTCSWECFLFLQHGFLIPHRLDFSTSGVLVTPLSRRACRAANAAFQGRQTAKFYLALLRGHVDLSKGRVLRVDCAIGQDSRPEWKNVRMACLGDPWCQNQRPSTTRLVVLSRGVYAGYPATKVCFQAVDVVGFWFDTVFQVLLQPVSGRRHQLRVHCKWLGHLIVGDYTYSDRRETEPFRMFLHAQRIILPNQVLFIWGHNFSHLLCWWMMT